MHKLTITTIILSFAFSLNSFAGQVEAEAISERVQTYHLPYDIIFGVITSEPSNHDVIAYDDAGDAALWTGLYLGAEAFRYSATRNPNALANVDRALRGIEVLTNAKGDGYLARAVFAVNGAWVEHFKQAEGGYGLHVFKHNGEDFYWQGRVTRDQYGGVYFGLSVAYDYVDDEGIRTRIRNTVTKLTDYLLKVNWTLWLDGKASTTFLQMPQQRLSMMKVAAQVNPGKFKKKYESMRFWEQNSTNIPIWAQTLDIHASYFKFNLEYLYMFNLLRLEPGNRAYRTAYNTLRKATASHFNASFNMYDRVLNGPNTARDAETREMLEERLARGFRNQSVDLRGKYKACDTNRSCDPLPVSERAFDGYMWQRSPFSLFYEGDARIEHAGIDYILPYWMARVFGVIQE